MDIANYGRQLKALLTAANHVLLITHPQPDADAVGSVAAMAQWLNSLNTTYTIFCVDQPPANLSWLINFQSFNIDPIDVSGGRYDAVVVLDCGDLKYAGAAEWLPRLSPRPPLVNIDHHATNAYFGDINIVDTAAASTTEILFQLFDACSFAVTTAAANALLAGIVFDTYNFTNPNTSDRALKAAAKLLSAGAGLTHINDLVLKTKTIGALQAWGRALSRLSFNSRWNMVSTVITEADVASGVAVAEIAEGAANFLNNVGGIGAALILYELSDGLIKGSFRTNSDLIDVSKLATLLGGGGHKKAAGFRLKGRLEKTDDGYWQVV